MREIDRDVGPSAVADRAPGVRGRDEMRGARERDGFGEDATGEDLSHAVAAGRDVSQSGPIRPDRTGRREDQDHQQQGGGRGVFGSTFGSGLGHGSLWMEALKYPLRKRRGQAVPARSVG